MPFAGGLDTAVMIWITEPDGACTHLSEGWYAFTGQSPETGLGFGWLEATHPDDRDTAARVFLAANERREPFRLDYRLRRDDGAYRWVIDSAAPRFAPDGEFLGYVGTVVDITERREIEETLRESEARFRALFTAIDEGYCLCEMIVDEAGRPVDYRFLEANPLFETMTGLKDAVGRTALELVPDLEPHWVTAYGKVALEGAPLRFQQGSEAMGRWFDVFALPVEPHGRFALVFNDITQRKRADDALRERGEAERRARGQAELLAEVGSELDAIEGVDARVARLLELLVPHVADEASVMPAAEDDEQRLSPGELRVPLELGTGTPSALRLALTDPERPRYTAEDLTFARRIADRAGVVFARARRLEEEHEIALRLQQALLPDDVLEHPGVEIAARYAAASGPLEIGGDWYDTFMLPGGLVGVTVGDVVGHGLDAASTMGRLSTALAALMPLAGGPGRTLTYLDAYAVGPNRVDFATACCAVLDPGSGELRYASAGHPPPLVVPARGEAYLLEDGRSPPLYGRAHADRAEAAVRLEPGSLLVFYSDGLIERRSEPLGIGLERLRQAAMTGRDEPAGALCDRLVRDLGVDVDREDDVVVVCLRLTGAPAT
jgi:PAS domain S-box-containing protein